jgi:phosphomethylpyrimidine synthase
MSSFLRSPGHVPMHMIKENMEKQLEHCDEAPFTYGTINNWYCWLWSHLSYWGGMIGWYGCAMLCYVKEHMSVCNKRDGALRHTV